MKICISEKSVKDFNSYFRAKAIELQKKNNYTNVNDLYKALYNEAMLLSGDSQSVNNHDVVIQHLVLAPLALNGAISSLQDQVAKSMSESFSVFTSPEKLEELVLKMQDVVNTPIEVNVEDETEVEPEEIDYDIFSLTQAIHVDFNTTQGSETINFQNIVDQDKVLTFKSVRNIIEQIKQGNTDYRLLAMSYDKMQARFKDRSKLDLSTTSLPKSDFGRQNAVVFFIADAKGNVLEFDANGQITKDGKIPVMSPLSPTTVGDEYFQYSQRTKDLSKPLHLKFAAIEKAYGVETAKEFITAQFTRNKKLFVKIRNSDGMLLNIDPVSSTYGYNEETKTSTPLSEVKEVEKFTIAKVKTPEGNPFVITGHTLFNHSSVIIPDYLDTDSKVIDTIVELLTNPALTYNGNKITPKVIRDILSNYTAVTDYSYLRINDRGDIYLHKTKVQQNDPMKAEKVRNFLTKFNAVEAVASNPQNRPVVTDLNSPDVTSAMLYQDNSGQLYKIYKPKFSYNKETISEVKIENGKTVTTKQLNKNQHIINHSSTKAFVNSAGELKVYHPKFAYDVDAESYGLDKSFYQKNSNARLTKGQEAAALSWMNQSLLTTSGKVSLKNEKLNSEDRPKDRVAVARWIGNAIVLFKGSDYTDLYHEAWHAYSQGILTIAEKKQLYSEIKQKPGFENKTDKEIEEYLAEEFRVFAMNGGKFKTEPSTLLGRLFNNIYNQLKSMFGKYSMKDLTVDSVIQDIIKENFTKLYTNDFDIQSYDSSNFMFNTLNKNLEFDNNSSELINRLSSQQTSLLVETIDSLIADHLDKNNTEKLSKGYESVENIKNAYKFAAEELKDILEAEEEALNKAPFDSEEFNLRMGHVEMLTAALANFGDLENMADNMFGGSIPTNVIGFHLLNGKIFDYEVIKKTVELDLSYADEDNSAGRQYERTGNDQSLYDMADEHVVYLLSSIKKYKTVRRTITAAQAKSSKDIGKVVYGQIPDMNVLGITKLERPVVVLAKLGKLLNSTTNGDKMYELMQKAALTDLVIREVLEKLGPFKSDSFSQQLLWSKFIQTFSKSKNILQQFIIESSIVETNSGQQIKLESKYGSTLSGTKAVSRVWDASFPTSNSPYIIPTTSGITMNVEGILNDLLVDLGNGKWKLKNKDEYVNFYNALGLDVTDNFNLELELIDNQDILEAIATRLKNHVEVNNFRKLNLESPIQIGSLKQLFGNHYKMSGEEVLKQKGLNSYYNRLQRIEFNLSDKYNSFMSVNAEGESQSELSLNNTASLITNAVNEIPVGTPIGKVIEDYPFLSFLNPENDPFMKANKFYKDLFDEAGLRTNAKLTFENFSGATLLQGDDFIGLANMSLDDDSKFMVDVYLSFYNKSEVVRMADKTTSMHMGTNRPQAVSAQTMENISSDPMDPTMYMELKDYIVAEIVRMNLLESLDTPFDNAYKERGNEFFIFDDMLSDKVKDALYAIKSTDFNEVSKAVTNLKVGSKSGQNMMIENINNYFATKTQLTIENNSNDLFITDNILQTLQENVNKGKAEEEHVELTETEAKNLLISMYQRNKFLHNVHVTAFYLGDPALYNVDKQDFHKRVAGLISTGDVFRDDQSFLDYINTRVDGLKSSRGWSNKVVENDTYQDYDGTLNVAVINDHIVESVYMDELKEVLNDFGDYPNMNEADGQGFIAFDSYRLLNIAQGIWSNEQEEQYNLIVSKSSVINGKVVPGSYDQTKFNTYFPAMKLQHFGPMKTTSPLRQQAFHKFNLIPLIPGMIKDTKLEILHEKMMEQGVDYMTFRSGSKLSTVSNNESGSDQFYDKDTRELNTDIEFEKNVIFTKYLKNQLKIHNHFTGRVTLPSQMRKILVSSIFKKSGTPKDYSGTLKQWNALTEAEKIKASDLYSWKDKYINALNDIVKYKKTELLNELGIKSEMSLIEDSSKLVNLIRREFESKDYSAYHIEFLFDNGQLKSDLSTALMAGQVEKLLLALVDKRITKLKVTGEGLIQMASTMSESAVNPKMINPTKEQLKEYGTNGLRSYFKKNGKIVGAQVKIALQGNYEKLLYTKGLDGKKITVYNTVTNAEGETVKVLDYNATLLKLNELIKNEEWLNKHRDIITLAGPRIPSQDWNSLEFMEIAEFLPKNAGNIMIVASEIVAKSGSDFDVDKLSTMFPSFDLYDGIPELIKYTDINTDVDSLKTNLSEKRTEVVELQKSLNPLYKELNENEDLMEIAREIYPLIKESRKLAKKKDSVSVQRFQDIEKELEVLRSKQETIIGDVLEEGEKISSNSELREQNKEVWAEINSIKNEIQMLNTQIDYMRKQINGASIKGLENNLLGIIIERMQKEDIYKDLVKPNSTAKVQPLANELEDKVATFDKTQRVYGKNKTTEKGKKLMSKTMIFDPAFNNNKLSENSVGKDTLGIGAKGTSYFALFTSIGMYLNPTNGISLKKYEDLKAKVEAGTPMSDKEKEQYNGFIDYRLQLDHNTKVEIVNGEPTTVIDLSSFENSKGDGIGDILGQLINGWVDVAKDAWIFNIQGNKEVAPTLIYLIMAGVDVREAVMLSSSKYVREYIKAKNKFNSAFYGLTALDKSDSDTFDLIQFHSDLDAANEVLKNIDPSYFLSNINDAYGESRAFDKPMDIKHIESLVLNPKKKRTDYDNEQELQAFLQFIAAEQTGRQLTSLMTTTAFDTKTYTTLVEVRNNKNKFDTLTNNPALPSNIQEMIAGSAIGMFNTNDFQLNLWEKFFALKTHPIINDTANEFYKGDLYQDGRTRSDNEKDFAEEFLSYLYQNESSRIENDTYLGYYIDTYEDESEFKTSFEIKDGIFYYDPSFVEGLVSKKELGNTYSVLKYHIEITALNETVDMESKEVKASISYQMALDNVDVEENDEGYAEALKKEYLKAEATIRSGNSVQLFKGPYSYSNRLAKLKEKFPLLAKQFYLVNDLSPDSLEGGMSNLFLLNIKETGYVDIYTENLEILKEHFDPEIKQFFKIFDRYALLQSGTKSYGKYVMTNIIDPGLLDSVVYPVRNNIIEQFDKLKNNELTDYSVLDDFATQFYKLDGNKTPNLKAFKGFIASKYRGVNFESDYYFEDSVRDADVSPMSLDLLNDTEVKPLDRKMANASTKVIVATVTNTPNVNYQKYSRINKYKSHISQYYPQSVDTSYTKDDVVWIVGEELSNLAYGSENNKADYTKVLESVFEKDYRPAIDKALKNGVTKFNIGTGSGIETMARQYLKKQNIESVDNTESVVEITSEFYTKDTAPNNPEIGFIFTENAQMLDTNKNVSQTQAVIRTDRDGNKNENALPIITKKLQKAGADAQWSDTTEDFEEFKRLNTAMIARIKNKNYSKLVFPAGFATDKATLPTRFAEWLQKELMTNFGVITELNQTKSGLITKSVKESKPQFKVADVPIMQHKIVTKDGIYYSYSTESEIIVDQLYSTLGGEIDIANYTPILTLKNQPINLTLNNQSYDNFYRYFAALKSSKATKAEIENLKEEASKFTKEPTAQEWMTLINRIKVDRLTNSSYDEELEIRRALFRIAEKNSNFKNELVGSSKTLLTYGSGITNFEKNYARALMELRKYYNGPVTKKATGTTEDPFTC